jgi:hypothetical protein
MTNTPNKVNCLRSSRRYVFISERESSNISSWYPLGIIGQEERRIYVEHLLARFLRPGGHTCDTSCIEASSLRYIPLSCTFGKRPSEGIGIQKEKNGILLMTRALE